MSISGSRTTSKASSVNRAVSPTTVRARVEILVRDDDDLNSPSRPACDFALIAMRARRNVPPPTVPMPSRPTWIGFMEAAS